TFEPIKDLKIEITADRTYAQNFQEYYVADSILGDFKHSNSIESGNFSMSYITWGTSFGGLLDDNKSEYFENLKEYRYEIAMRLAQDNINWSREFVDSTGFPLGYGPTSQQVLLPSFLAAYSGKGPNKVDLDAFPKIPLPNWRVTYNGLSKIDFLKEYFKSVTLSHSYRCSYAVGSFSSNVYYKELNEYPIEQNIINGNYYPQYDFGQVSITEQYSPLLSVDVILHNSFMSKIEMKRSRNLSLSFVNNQLTEVTGNEFIVGLGYRFKEVPFSFRAFGGGPKKTVKSDLNIKIDFSIRSNKTILRRIDVPQNQISAGQKIISINFSADYMINQKLDIRLFFDEIITNPFLASQFRNSTVNGGISLRFMLNQ
ncbi:MAG: cell surface protein SprA, partial [Bacteroidales bacterium]|nr:cell surface protein SprA [Bacteroidales bacterium]